MFGLRQIDLRKSSFLIFGQNDNCFRNFPKCCDKACIPQRLTAFSLRLEFYVNLRLLVLVFKLRFLSDEMRQTFVYTVDIFSIAPFHAISHVPFDRLESSGQE